MSTNLLDELAALDSHLLLLEEDLRQNPEPNLNLTPAEARMPSVFGLPPEWFVEQGFKVNNTPGEYIWYQQFTNEYTKKPYTVYVFANPAKQQKDAYGDHSFGMIRAFQGKNNGYCESGSVTETQMPEGDSSPAKQLIFRKRLARLMYLCVYSRIGEETLDTFDEKGADTMNDGMLQAHYDDLRDYSTRTQSDGSTP